MITTKRRNVVRMAWIIAAVASAGCSGRTLVITKDPVINTANRIDFNKPPAERRGETLKVAVICLGEDDFAKAGTGPIAELAPATSTMTSKEFFEKEGSLSSVSKKVFDVVGAKIDGKDTQTERFKFPGKLFKGNSVIYVFAKFVGPNGEVIPVKPVKFNPVWHYTGTLKVHISANEKLEGDTYGQNIENKSKEVF